MFNYPGQVPRYLGAEPRTPRQTDSVRAAALKDEIEATIEGMAIDGDGDRMGETNTNVIIRELHKAIDRALALTRP